jgi:hypothetical protein
MGSVGEARRQRVLIEFNPGEVGRKTERVLVTTRLRIGLHQDPVELQLSHHPKAFELYVVANP